MANEKQLNILKQGVDAWNQWRKEHPYVERPDLQEAKLQEANLYHADLRKTDLWEADLWRADSRFISTVGAVSLEVVKQYIEGQKGK